MQEAKIPRRERVPGGREPIGVTVTPDALDVLKRLAAAENMSIAGYCSALAEEHAKAAA